MMDQHVPDVQNVDSAIHRINLHQLDSVTGFTNTYPLDSDLSGGYRSIQLLNSRGQDSCLAYSQLGTGQKVKGGGRAGAFGNVVIKTHDPPPPFGTKMTDP